MLLLLLRRCCRRLLGSALLTNSLAPLPRPTLPSAKRYGEAMEQLRSTFEECRPSPGAWVQGRPGGHG